MNKEQEKGGKSFGDSDFLAMNDMAIRNFRANENDAKRKIVKKMLTLRHNMKYNKHLLSVYMKAKELFDKMVDEHRSQLHSLDEIYRHLNHLIHENISKKRIQSKNSVSSEIMAELVKDKMRIGGLVKKMRNSYDKLMNVDTIIGVTVDKINEITFIDDDDANVKLRDKDDENNETEEFDDNEEDEYEEEDEVDEVDEEDEEEEDEDDEVDEVDDDDEDEEEEDDDEEEEDEDEDEDEEEEDKEATSEEDASDSEQKNQPNNPNDVIYVF
jgi:hypothetical protein